MAHQKGEGGSRKGGGRAFRAGPQEVAPSLFFVCAFVAESGNKKK